MQNQSDNCAACPMKSSDGTGVPTNSVIVLSRRISALERHVADQDEVISVDDLEKMVGG